MKQISELPQSNLEVLVFAAVRKDAELTVNVLQNAGFVSRAIFDIGQLSESLSTAGVVVLSEEVLSKTLLEALKVQVAEQPQWSDLPFILVTSGGSSSTASNERLEWVASYLQNVTLLERPIRLATLITIIRTALSSRKKQFELKAMMDQLEKSKRAADEANQAKSMFLANMSHEIRTPLAAIVGFTSLMRDTNLPATERLEFADVVARNGEQLSGLINDILDLSKVESGKLEVEQIELSFPTFLSEVTSWLRPIVEAKGLGFTVEFKSKLPKIVKADSTRIRQVLLNLVSNAAKFTQRGKISIAVEVKESGDSQAKIFFEVSDTGIGISDKDRERLFKPFSQADSSMTRKYGGTGLGLVLSKALANIMGGDLKLVHSEIGKGSKFEFSFAVELLKSKSQDKKKLASGDALRGMKVLLVEDSPDNQFLMNRYLQGAGAEVVTAENGKVAVEFALQKSFDAILMDIQMPIMDGLTATRELRSRNYIGPIIALTAHALKEERERSLKAGCNTHLTKPVDRELLISTLASYAIRPPASIEPKL